MAKEPRAYYENNVEQTGRPVTEGIVVVDEDTVVEKQDGEWVGPFDNEFDEERVERVGKVTSDQLEAIQERVEE